MTEYNFFSRTLFLLNELMSKKRKLYRAISLISLIIMLIAVGMILWIFSIYRRSNKEYKELADAARAEVSDPAETSEAVDILPDSSLSDGTEPINYVEIPINFDYLCSLNEDIIGWITVDGTDIDYPILYDDTIDRYYLYHNYLGTYTLYGSIFMLGENASDFSDFNTVVYGHNMLDGKMFAQLHNFESQSFFDEHKDIVVYTPERKLTYRIFAAYRTDNLNIIVNNDFSTPALRESYIEKIYSHEIKSIFDPDTIVTSEDRIITLSTCIANAAYRYLVQGVLISDEEGSFAVG